MRLLKLGGHGYRNAFVVLPDSYKDEHPVAVVMSRPVINFNSNKVITIPKLLQAQGEITVVIPISIDYVAYSYSIARLLFGLSTRVSYGYSRWLEPIEVPVIDISGIVRGVRKATRLRQDLSTEDLERTTAKPVV